MDLIGDDEGLNGLTLTELLLSESSLRVQIAGGGVRLEDVRLLKEVEEAIDEIRRCQDRLGTERMERLTHESMRRSAIGEVKAS